MRLDLFLKQSGLIKRRPVAKAMCDGGKIKRQNATAKAADEVRPGDVLIISYGFKTTEVRILDVPRGSIGRAQRDDYFQIIRETRQDGNDDNRARQADAEEQADAEDDDE